MYTLTIDEAMMGTEWRGGTDGLESFADILREQDRAGWQIEVCRGAYNGGGIVDDDGLSQDDYVEYPERQWLMALDRHAAAHPDLWA